MKPFFVHILPSKYQFRPHKYNGATVFVQPGGERTVNVQVAVCSKKDPYNKKIGRETALSHPCKLVNKREFPKFLAGLQGYVDNAKDPLPSTFEYIYKYLL